ncbi:MAG: hypothetical protein M3328_04670, partial [Chloroflexota bacterium]|nr:hypothetical protein [Chloroflexota bacterium]
MSTTLESNLAEYSLSGTGQERLPLVSSVLGALVYADLFDAPLTLDEIRRYQIATSYSAAEIAAALHDEPELVARVSTDGTNYCLKGREGLFHIRKQRAANSARVWK